MWTRPTPARRRRRDDWHRSDGGLWLPGAADVPRVAGDPMRGAGMVRRGMGFGFEPAGCCCKQPGLCQVDSSLGNSYDVTFTGIPSFATCDEQYSCMDMVCEDIDLNHTYRLTISETYQTCEWELAVPNAYTLVDCRDCNGYWVEYYPYKAYPLPYSFGVTIRMLARELYGDPSKIQAQIYIFMNPNTLNQAASGWYTLDKAADALDGWSGSGDTYACCQSVMFANWSWSVQRAA